MARRKAYVLSEDEHLWGGFLIDLNAQDAVSLFKKARITVRRPLSGMGQKSSG
jgi:hypothetical protein